MSLRFTMKSAAKISSPDYPGARETSRNNVPVSTILAGRFKCPPKRRSRTSKVTPIQKFQRQSVPSLGRNRSPVQHPRATAVPRNKSQKPGRSNHKESSLDAALLKLLLSQEQSIRRSDGKRHPPESAYGQSCLRDDDGTEKIEAESSPAKMHSVLPAVATDEEKDEYREESTSVMETSPEELSSENIFKNLRRKLRALADNVLEVDKKPSTSALGAQAVNTLMRKLRDMSLYNVSSGGSGQSSGCNPMETQEMPSSPPADCSRQEAISKADMETLGLSVGIGIGAPNQLYLKMSARQVEEEYEEKFVTLGDTSSLQGLAREKQPGCDNEGLDYHRLGSPIMGDNTSVPEEFGSSSHSDGDGRFFLKTDFGRAAADADADADGGGSQVGYYSDFKSCVDLNFSDSPRETTSHSRAMNNNSHPEDVEDQLDMPSREKPWFEKSSIHAFPVLEGYCEDDALQFSNLHQVALTREEDSMRMDIQRADDFCNFDNTNEGICFSNLSTSPESLEESSRDSPFNNHGGTEDSEFQTSRDGFKSISR